MILLMIEILHDLKDPKLCELWCILIMGNAGSISSTVLKALGHMPHDYC